MPDRYTRDGSGDHGGGAELAAATIALDHVCKGPLFAQVPGGAGAECESGSIGVTHADADYGVSEKAHGDGKGMHVCAHGTFIKRVRGSDGQRLWVTVVAVRLLCCPVCCPPCKWVWPTLFSH
jgi:hypothetical protein